MQQRNTNRQEHRQDLNRPRRASVNNPLERQGSRRKSQPKAPLKWLIFVAVVVVLLVLLRWLFVRGNDSNNDTADAATSSEQLPVEMVAMYRGGEESTTREVASSFSSTDTIEVGMTFADVGERTVTVRVFADGSEIPAFQVSNIRVATKSNVAYVSAGSLEPGSYRAEVTLTQANPSFEPQAFGETSFRVN